MTSAEYYAKKARNREIAEETMNITKDGFYTKNGTRVDIPAHKSYTVRDAEIINKKTAKNGTAQNQTYDTCFVLSNVDSFEAARAFLNDTTGAAVHNFASARHPGGGFRNGAMAQEECLCRESTLYASLRSSTAISAYYDRNQKWKKALYPEHMLFNPHVAVIRDGNNELLDEPFALSVFTLAAPNLKGRAKNVSRHEVDSAMKTCFEMMLDAAAVRGVTTLVLGAWGCGAFGHDPRHVAHLLRTILVDEGRARNFQNIIFAIRSEAESDNIRAFSEEFRDVLGDRIYVDRDVTQRLDESAGVSDMQIVTMEEEAPARAVHAQKPADKSESPVCNHIQWRSEPGLTNVGWTRGTAEDGTIFEAELLEGEFAEGNVDADGEFSKWSLLSVLIPITATSPQPSIVSLPDGAPVNVPRELTKGLYSLDVHTLLDIGMQNDGDEEDPEVIFAWMDHLEDLGIAELTADEDFTLTVHYRTDVNGTKLAKIFLSLVQEVEQAETDLEFPNAFSEPQTAAHPADGADPAPRTSRGKGKKREPKSGFLTDSELDYVDFAKVVGVFYTESGGMGTAGQIQLIMSDGRIYDMNYLRSVSLDHLFDLWPDSPIRAEEFPHRKGWVWQYMEAGNHVFLREDFYKQQATPGNIYLTVRHELQKNK